MTKQPPPVRVVTDPAELPLFTRPVPPVTRTPQAVGEATSGRVRSTFVFKPDSSGPAEPDSDERPPAGPARPRIVQEAGSATGLDWGLVAALLTAASERLMRALEMNPHIEHDEQQALGRRIIADLLDEEAKQSASAGRGAFDRHHQSTLAQAVFDALFRLGRLQPLVDDPGVENVTILGHDDVWL